MTEYDLLKDLLECISSNNPLRTQDDTERMRQYYYLAGAADMAERILLRMEERKGTIEITAKDYMEFMERKLERRGKEKQEVANE